MRVAVYSRYRGFGVDQSEQADIFEWPDFDAQIREVERLWEAMVLSEEQYQGSAVGYIIGMKLPAWAVLLRSGIDDWETAKLEAAKAGQMSWAEWQQSGRALADACAKIAGINANYDGTTVYLNALKASVVRDVKTVVKGAQTAAAWGAGTILAAILLAAAFYGWSAGKGAR